MVYVALGTIVSFMLFCMMRDSSLTMDDTFIGCCERFVFGCFKLGWLAGVVYLIYHAIH